LCRQEITPQRQLGREQLSGMHIATELQPAEGPLNLSSFNELSFHAGSGPTVTVTKPIHKAALLGLGRIYPEMVAFDSLSAFAHNEMGKVLVRNSESHGQDMADLAGLVLELFAKDLITLQNRPPRYATKPGDRPTASPLARHQAADEQFVTTLSHGMIPLNDLTKRLLPLLDGTRDRKALREFLEGLAVEGKIVIEQYGVQQDPKSRPELLERLLEQELQSLARNGVLVR
jgi:methyltransferase-like protein